MHGYFDVDIDAVWTTIQKDIPNLKYDIEIRLFPTSIKSILKSTTVIIPLILI
ncbi:MAG: HepT-like ribonuclease domain-containing protein [Thermoplasmatota archaeon]